MNSYLVQYPTRGTQTVIVQASTAKEAREIVNNRRFDEDTAIDHEITWSGKANYVELQDSILSAPATM